MLLVILRIVGSYIAINLKDQLSTILSYYNLRNCFSNIITNNASKNRAYLNFIIEDLKINTNKRYVLYVGYIINLVAYKGLFSSNAKAFKYELEGTIIAELVELNS